MHEQRPHDAGADGDVQSNVTAYWNGHSGAYDEHQFSRLHAAEAKAASWVALRAALPPPPADILDVGTGTGFLSLLLAEHGCRVVGIDLAEQMLATARAKAASLDSPPVLQVGDAVEPPFPPQSFDAVTNRYLL